MDRVCFGSLRFVCSFLDSRLDTMKVLLFCDVDTEKMKGFKGDSRQTLLSRLSRISNSMRSRFWQTTVGRTYEQGLAAYKSGRYGEALITLKPYAKSGDRLAQLTLGNIYNNGLGINKDKVVAAKWYHRAAIQGDPDAQFNLGVMYLRGEVVTAAEIEGIQWLQKAAKQGHKRARFAYDYISRDKISAHL